MLVKDIRVGRLGMERSIYRDSRDEDRYSDSGNNVFLHLRKGYWTLSTRERGNTDLIHSRHRSLPIGLAAMETRIHNYYDDRGAEA